MNRYVEAAEIFTSLFAEIYSEQTSNVIREKFGSLIVKWFKVLMRALEHGRWKLDMDSAWAVPSTHKGNRTDDLD